MYGTIKCLTEDVSLVMCFYLYFPFCYDSYQIRQFLAYSIVVFGIRFLIQEKREIGKYVLCVLIATLLHKSAVVYFLYLLSIFSTSENNFGKHILRVTVIASVLLVLLRVDIIGILGRLLKNDKFISYSFSNEEYRMNFYLQVFEIAMMVIILLIDKTIVAWNENNEYYAKLLPILEISLLFLPFIIISLVFERLIRPFLIFSYCLVSSNLSNDQEQENSLPFILLAAIIIIRMSVSFGYIEKLFSNCTLV